METFKEYAPPCDGQPPADLGAGAVYYKLGDNWDFTPEPGWFTGDVYRYPPRQLTAMEIEELDRNFGDLPDANPKTAAGAKKTPLASVIPPIALVQIGEVMRLGAQKYGPFNWRDQSVTASTYVDAALRHILSWWDGETIDPESGQPHLAHAMASLAIISDALAVGAGADDRPKPGATARTIAELAASR